MSLKVLNIIKGISKSKSLENHVSCYCGYAFDSRKYNLKQKWNDDKCQFELKK